MSFKRSLFILLEKKWTRKEQMKANNIQVFGFASNIMLTPHRQPTLQKLRL